MKTEERVILKELFFKNSPISLYSLHEKYKLSVIQVFRTVKSLRKKKYICCDGKNIFFNEEKKNTIIINYEDIFCKIEQTWKNKVDFSKKISNNLKEDLKGFE